jgi:hypothetical protein
VTIFLLIIQLFINSEAFMSLIPSLLIAIGTIAFFNYHDKVAKNLSFKKRFVKLVNISLGVAGISLLIGLIIKTTLGVSL